MTFFQIETEVNASAQLVWKIMRDVEHWPEWTPTVKSIRLRTPPPLAIGSCAIIRQPKLPPALWRVVELMICIEALRGSTRRLACAFSHITQ